MIPTHSPRQFDAREEGNGNVAARTERIPARDDDDSPDTGAEPGPSASDPPSPGKSDGVAELKKMEQNAEDGRE